MGCSSGHIGWHSKWYGNWWRYNINTSITFLQDMNQQQAQGINLIYFVPTAVIALITHIRNKKIEVKAVKSIVLTGLIGAAIGAFLAVKMDATLLRKFLEDFCYLWDCQRYFIKRSIKMK